jgi:hypothetical protein
MQQIALINSTLIMLDYGYCNNWVVGGEDFQFKEAKITLTFFAVAPC